jgi:hypothetical protein
MSGPSRRPEIRRRQTRKVKLDKLRRRYAAASGEEDRQKLFDKAKRLSPQMKLEQFTKEAVEKA